MPKPRPRRAGDRKDYGGGGSPQCAGPMRVKSKGSHRARSSADDAPEITGKWIAEAQLYRGRKVVRRGRPAGSGKKTQVTLRISKEVLEFFRATGPGWQTRMDAALKGYVDSRRP